MITLSCIEGHVTITQLQKALKFCNWTASIRGWMKQSRNKYTKCCLGEEEDQNESDGQKWKWNRIGESEDTSAEEPRTSLRMTFSRPFTPLLYSTNTVSFPFSFSGTPEDMALCFSLARSYASSLLFSYIRFYMYKVRIGQFYPT